MNQRIAELQSERQNSWQKILGFLRGGSSKHPLDLLRDAGVDMETPGPVDAALKRFGELVDELERLTAGA